MKLFFDEDAGKGVPEALRLVGLRVDYVSNKGRIKKGTRDEDWIPYAGRAGFLVFSCNKGILEAEAQRDLFVKEKVGAVSLTTGQERRIPVLLLILKKLGWLEDIDANVPRPFAFEMTIGGKTKRVL